MKNINIPPKKILWVEDDKMIAELGKSWLEMLGFEALMAKNGQEALKVMEKDFCSIVITDLQMPIMNGYDLIRKLREIYEKKCFIIIVSGSYEQMKINGISNLADAKISKPVSLGELKKIIQTQAN